MKIIKRELETHHVNFIGPIIDLLYVETINGKYYAYFETDESIGNTKVSIRLLETDKEYKSEDMEGYCYKQTIPSESQMAADLFGSIIYWPAEATEYHVYYKIDYDYINEEELKKKEQESKEEILEKINELVGESKPIITIKTTIKPRINIDKLNRLI